MMTAQRHQRNFPIRLPWVMTAMFLLLLTILPVHGRHPAPEADHFAPDFSLPDLEGKQVSLSNYKGKVVLLNFWATWCPPCRLEMPTIEQAYRKYKPNGFEVVAVSVDAGPTSAVKHFLEEFGLSFQVLRDPGMETLRAFRTFSLPTSFVIDRRGIIRLREPGYRDWTDAQSTTLLQELLTDGPL